MSSAKIGLKLKPPCNSKVVQMGDTLGSSKLKLKLTILELDGTSLLKAGREYIQ